MPPNSTPNISPVPSSSTWISPKGRVAQIDASAALRSPGVLDVLTHENRPPHRRTDAAWKDEVAPETVRRFARFMMTRSCSTASRSRSCSRRIAIRPAMPPRWWCRLRRNRHTLPISRRSARTPSSVEKPEKPRGDADKAFADAAVRHEAEYLIPIEHHNPMELYAATGSGKAWQAHGLRQDPRRAERSALSLQRVRQEVGRCCASCRPSVGGAFGAGLRPQYQVVLAVLGARALKRSVRLVLTRQQMYALGYRPATIQRIALGAKADGTLTRSPTRPSR